VHIEKRQSVSEDALTDCESCGGKLEKQWSLSGFHFKGEGWYVTDYAGKKGGASANSDSSVEKTSTSESTPAATTASKETANEKPAEKPSAPATKE
jgi:putative FmdB family regulatory protein